MMKQCRFVVHWLDTEAASIHLTKLIWAFLSLCLRVCAAFSVPVFTVDGNHRRSERCSELLLLVFVKGQSTFVIHFLVLTSTC